MCNNTNTTGDDEAPVAWLLRDDTGREHITRRKTEGWDRVDAVPLYARPQSAAAQNEINIPFVADCLRNYAALLTDGGVDGSGHYLPADINEAADDLERVPQSAAVRDDA